uniref:Uncharacterized protein n=1 Tax=Setaria digitata TaxID=48799 RepID=A0A915PLS8_9BILA
MGDNRLPRNLTGLLLPAPDVTRTRVCVCACMLMTELYNNATGDDEKMILIVGKSIEGRKNPCGSTLGFFASQHFSLLHKTLL